MVMPVCGGLCLLKIKSILRLARFLTHKPITQWDLIFLQLKHRQRPASFVKIIFIPLHTERPKQFVELKSLKIQAYCALWSLPPINAAAADQKVTPPPPVSGDNRPACSRRRWSKGLTPPLQRTASARMSSPNFTQWRRPRMEAKRKYTTLFPGPHVIIGRVRDTV